MSIKLAENITRFTDYLANLKIPIKDIAIKRLYLEPLKWDYSTLDNKILGKGAGLLTKCLDSTYFWDALKSNHLALRPKYPCSDLDLHKIKNDIDIVEKEIKLQYE